eukprot:4342181-Pyramimonas_sp.AAC.1
MRRRSRVGNVPGASAMHCLCADGCCIGLASTTISDASTSVMRWSGIGDAAAMRRRCVQRCIWRLRLMRRPCIGG